VREQRDRRKEWGEGRGEREGGRIMKWVELCYLREFIRDNRSSNFEI
jgi:hypothetical protein